MAAIMVIDMVIGDDVWEETYFAAVPSLLAEYGAFVLAGSRAVHCIEGDGAPPDRVAVLSFPSLDAVDRFMDDQRYAPFRQLREAGARSRILVFDNAVRDSALV